MDAIELEAALSAIWREHAAKQEANGWTVNAETFVDYLARNGYIDAGLVNPDEED